LSFTRDHDGRSPFVFDRVAGGGFRFVGFAFEDHRDFVFATAAGDRVARSFPFGVDRQFFASGDHGAVFLEGHRPRMGGGARFGFLGHGRIVDRFTAGRRLRPVDGDNLRFLLDDFKFGADRFR
jgi:hypothetical protein